MPSIVLMTAIGRSAAKSWIASNAGPAVSRSAAALARVGTSRSATRRGVNERLTIARSSVWRGGSISISIGSTASEPRSSVMPPVEEKVCQSSMAARTSS